MKRLISVICLGLLLSAVMVYTAETEKPAKSSSLTDRIKFKGDLRYRHELIDEEGKDQRNRQRIRARIGLDARLTRNVSLGFQLASGSDDPISTNQTLDEGFSTKDIRLDMAYFDLHTGDGSFKLLGGKIGTPFTIVGKNQLIWDSDLRPEGLAAQISRSSGPVNVFASLSCLWVEERSGDVDSLLLGLQGGLKFKFSDGKAHFLGGFGYFDYTNTEGYPTFFNTEKSYGNTVDQDGNYLFDYNELEVFFELVFKAGNFPLSLFGDYVNNIAADADNKGWLVGFSAGKAGKPGSYDFNYNYRNLEKDAIVGMFTDSDFIGGGTDGKGHKLGFTYQLAKGAQAAVTYLLNKKGVDNGRDYHRLHLALKFKF